MNPALPQSPPALWWSRACALGAVALAFPAATLAVFALDAPREATADVLAVIYATGLFAAFSSALWPLPALSGWSRRERLGKTALLFVTVSAATHLSWELTWLLLHDTIAASPDAPWAYPWWAYIDGGDRRYAEPTSTLLVMEALSVANGLVGAAALALWRRQRRRRAVMLMMAMAVVHLYSTALYFGGELLEGLPNVNTDSALDLGVKFILANAPWIVFPVIVLRWGWGELMGRVCPPDGADLP